jgi:hypothetical protein
MDTERFLRVLSFDGDLAVKLDEELGCVPGDLG